MNERMKRYLPTLKRIHRMGEKAEREHVENATDKLSIACLGVSKMF